MIKVLYLAMSILAFIELYSIGVSFLAKKVGEKDYKLCYIPFYAFYVVNRIAGVFKVLTIPVRKFHGMMIAVSLVGIFALLYACWGDIHLPIQSSPALWQIMGVVLAVCGLLFWLAILSSSRKIFRRFNVKREGWATLIAALTITVPFQYIYYAKHNEPRSLKDMY